MSWLHRESSKRETDTRVRGEEWDERREESLSSKMTSTGVLRIKPREVYLHGRVSNDTTQIIELKGGSIWDVREDGEGTRKDQKVQWSSSHTKQGREEQKLKGKELYLSAPIQERVRLLFCQKVCELMWFGLWGVISEELLKCSPGDSV